MAPDLTPSERLGLKLEHNACVELNSKLPVNSPFEWRVRGGERTKIDKTTKRFYKASRSAEQSTDHGAHAGGGSSA